MSQSTYYPCVDTGYNQNVLRRPAGEKHEVSIQDIVASDIAQEDSSVWLLSQHSEFGYSEGRTFERYLEKVFRDASDLSNGSDELEKHIRDWSSEYHLSAKRQQLFAGFDFDSSLKVLEVGCGCGAITRYLGETFDDVIAIEGNIDRARLARLRTTNMAGVSIICAPFQSIKFSRKFDIIFCVGVYEYSGSFVAGEYPYDSVLSYFSDMLAPDGIVVIAIENQFGLKYFSSSREDHTGTMFEGLEGYHAQRNKVQTFGKFELEMKLGKYFSSIEMFYPYPDYKLPTCTISEEFLVSGRAGELVSQIESRDYNGDTKSLWNDSLVSLELSRNGMLPFFSNSFLVFAGKTNKMEVSFDQLAVISNSQRARKFRTQTRIHYDKNRDVVVLKKLVSGRNPAKADKLTLVESCSIWRNFNSLQTVVYGNCMSREMKLADMFSPLRVWVEFLESVSENINGENYVDGEYIDCILSNVYQEASGVAIVDKEWVWKDKIRVSVVVIRALFSFLCAIGNAERRSKVLRIRSQSRLISLIAESIGVQLQKRDFADFIILESEFQSLVHGSARNRISLMLRWSLFDTPSLHLFRRLKEDTSRMFHRAMRLIDRLYRDTLNGW